MLSAAFKQPVLVSSQKSGHSTLLPSRASSSTRSVRSSPLSHRSVRGFADKWKADGRPIDLLFKCVVVLLPLFVC